jgi:hypothetical protein
MDISEFPENVKAAMRKKFQDKWIDAITKVLIDLGGVSDIPTITDRVKGLRDLSNNSHLDETVRGTLNGNKKYFKRYSRGVWGVIDHNTSQK